MHELNEVKKALLQVKIKRIEMRKAYREVLDDIQQRRVEERNAYNKLNAELVANETELKRRLAELKGPTNNEEA